MDKRVTHLHHSAEQKMGKWGWNSGDFNVKKIRRKKEREKKEEKEREANLRFGV